MINRHAPPFLPQAPVDLMAVAVGGCQVILAWTESGAGGHGFRIERADDPGPDSLFSEIGDLLLPGSCMERFRRLVTLRCGGGDDNADRDGISGRGQAGEVARAVQGVKSVKNDLIVK